MVSFKNTEIAFKHLSDTQLKNARRLFSAFKVKSLSYFGPKVVGQMLKFRFPILAIVKKTMFAHFCGGETVKECKSLISDFGKDGVGSILDYSVEGASNEKTFNATVKEILRVIDEASSNEDIPFAVFKVTGICYSEILEKMHDGSNLTQKEKQCWERAKKRFEQICEYASEKGVRIFVDAEESWMQDPIDDLAEQAMMKFNTKEAIVFNTVQMYRSDRLGYITHIYARAKEKGFKLGFKLVRGAYMEKERERAEHFGYPSPINVSKKATDRDFDKSVEFCMSRLDTISICVATHNEKSVLKLAKMMKSQKVESTDERIWCAQLLGMSDNITYNLSDAGYNTAKYMPYGPVAEVLPYLFRRAEENSSIQGQSLREYDLLDQECKRRGL